MTTPRAPQASVELDRRVAVEVMGLNRACVVVIDGRCDRWCSAGPNTDFGDWIEWCPSTSIAHAWEVVERMRKVGYVTLTDCGNHWDAVHQRGADAVPIGARHESAPMAICLMALESLKSTAGGR